MRRTLITVVLCAAFVYATWRWGVGLLFGGPATIVVAPGEMMPLTDTLIVAAGVAWVVLFTWRAVDRVTDMASDARARRADAVRLAREEEALTPYLRIGAPPKRKDLAA